MLNDLGAGRAGQVMQFHVARKATDDSRVPKSLAKVEDLGAAPPVVTRTFRFAQQKLPDGTDGWTINKMPFDPGRADATPAVGAVERWRFVTDLHHPVHVHLDPFQVIKRGGKGPGPMDGGWKDTVDLGPAEVVEIAVRFSDYQGRYLLHCHNLEHEDMAMMSMFRTGKA